MHVLVRLYSEWWWLWCAESDCEDIASRKKVSLNDQTLRKSNNTRHQRDACGWWNQKNKNNIHSYTLKWKICNKRLNSYQAILHNISKASTILKEKVTTSISYKCAAVTLSVYMYVFLLKCFEYPSIKSNGKIEFDRIFHNTPLCNK